MTDDYCTWTDNDLVGASHRSDLHATNVEMLRRLKQTIIEQHDATTELNRKLLNLNVQLRNFTVGLYFIGAVQLLLFMYQLFLNP